MNSNILRLTVGWFFLMALTAAGTYYFTDEVDKKVGLEKYALHRKLGYARATLASITPTPPSITPVPPEKPPSLPITPPATSSSLTPPSFAPKTSAVPAPSSAPPSEATSPAISPAASGAASTPPVTYGVPKTAVTPAYEPPPVYSRPSGRGTLGHFGEPPSGDPAVRDRLTDVESRAGATYAQWQPIRRSLESMGQSLRPEVSAALSSMQRYVQQAHAAYRAGDNAAATHALDMAEKQIEILKQAREE